MLGLGVEIPLWNGINSYTAEMTVVCKHNYTKMIMPTSNWGQLYGTRQLHMTEQLLLVISYDEVVQYSYITMTSLE